MNELSQSAYLYGRCTVKYGQVTALGVPLWAGELRRALHDRLVRRRRGRREEFRAPLWRGTKNELSVEEPAEEVVRLLDPHMNYSKSFNASFLWPSPSNCHCRIWWSPCCILRNSKHRKSTAIITWTTDWCNEVLVIPGQIHDPCNWMWEKQAYMQFEHVKQIDKTLELELELFVTG
jgi:hypothetical protein